MKNWSTTDAKLTRKHANIFAGMKRLKRVLVMINSGKYCSEKYWQTWRRVLKHHKIDNITGDAILNGYIDIN